MVAPGRYVQVDAVQAAPWDVFQTQDVAEVGIACRHTSAMSVSSQSGSSRSQCTYSVHCHCIVVRFTICHEYDGAKEGIDGNDGVLEIGKICQLVEPTPSIHHCQ